VDALATTTPTHTPRGTTALHPLLHHATDTVRDLPGVEIPAAETPMIARNAAMRRGDQSGNRRGSLDKRGRRVSSIASGFDGLSFPDRASRTGSVTT
jgi:Mis12-Mtw1 protein family